MRPDLLERRHLPCLTASGEILLGDIHHQCVLFHIDGDFIAGSNERDWSAVLCFRRDVADEESMRSTGEAAIGNERDVLPSPAPITAEVGRLSGMPGPPSTFVSNHDHIPF